MNRQRNDLTMLLFYQYVSRFEGKKNVEVTRSAFDCSNCMQEAWNQNVLFISTEQNFPYNVLFSLVISC